MQYTCRPMQTVSQQIARAGRPYYRLLWPLVILIIAADQLTKALFVYLLGTHRAHGFVEFCLSYFQLLGDANGGAISREYFPFHQALPVWLPWIRFTLTTNTGAAWSIFEGNSFGLSFVSLAMALLLYFVWWKSFKSHAGMTWALGAIIGGALGNFVDRFRLREVVDFIDVKIPYIGQLFPKLGDPYDFPIFNVADSCAVCGTLALAAYLIISDIHSHLAASRARRIGQLAAPDYVDPFAEGAGLDESAVRRLQAMTRAQPRRTVIGLTVHIGIAGAAAEEE